MKIFLDDERWPDDKTYVIVRTVQDFVHWYDAFHDQITEISFDHDLGETESGYDAVCHVERCVVENQWMPPATMVVHSMNPVGQSKINAAISNIYSMWEKQNGKN